MKILYVINKVPSPGHNIHSLNLVRELSEEHEISLACFETDSPFVKEYKYYKNTRLVPCIQQNIFSKGIKSLLFNIPFCVLTNQSVQMVKTIHELSRDIRFDIVICEPLAMGEYFTHLKDYPKFLYPVDATSRIKLQKLSEERNILKKAILYIDYLMIKKYEEFIYKKFDGIIFCSDYDTNYTLKNIKVNQDKVFTLPIAVDHSYFHPNTNPSEQKLSVAFSGAMDFYPNHHGMIWFYNNVWKRLKKRFPDLFFYIIGSNPSQQIKDLAKQDSNIVITGYVDDLRPYIWQASLFISPLQIGTGMKNKVLQAMAMGKAVVASPLDVQGIQGENKKHYLIADNPEEFLQHITFLLQHKEKRVEIGTNARNMIENKYTLKDKYKNFMNIAKRTIQYKCDNKKQIIH